jgi:hypothetical protein
MEEMGDGWAVMGDGEGSVVMVDGVSRGAPLALMYVLRTKYFNTVKVTRCLRILKVLPLQ